MTESKQFASSVFWFRQDLRIQDNTGLIQAVRDSKSVFPVFIFDENILAKSPAHDPRCGFLIDAIEQLEHEIDQQGGKLHLFIGNPEEIIPRILKTTGSKALFMNRSYGVGSKDRDCNIQKRCHQHDITVRMCNDYLLVEPGAVEARKVFTPFYKLRQQQPKADVDSTPIHIHGSQDHIAGSYNLGEIRKHIDWGENTSWPVQDIQKKIQHFEFEHYDSSRNLPSQTTGTSHMSPYIRFGLISIRQLYHASKDRSPTYVSELAWREFWQHIAHHFPESRFQEFQEKRRNLERGNNPEWLEKRKNGETGYPLVDAGMRQLKSENRMHNRVRMVVASFLCKDLLIDRRYGEAHFAQYLLDYDLNVNIGNRQRAASVGADPKPLRIFNPSLQSQRFDPDARYIRKRIPELTESPLEHIHNPEQFALPYCPCIISHKEYSQYAKLMYAKKPFTIKESLF